MQNEHVIAYYRAKTLAHMDKYKEYDKLGHSTLAKGCNALINEYANLWAIEIDYRGFVPGIVPEECGCNLIIA